MALIVDLVTNAWVAPGYAGSAAPPTPVVSVGMTSAAASGAPSDPSAGLPPYPVLTPWQQSGPLAKLPVASPDQGPRQRRLAAGSAAGASAFPARPEAGSSGLVVTATTIGVVVILGVVIAIAAADSSGSSADSSSGSSSSAESSTTATE
jgi:hypothetical protein